MELKKSGTSSCPGECYRKKFTIFLKSLPPLPLQSRVAYFVSLLSIGWALLLHHLHLLLTTFSSFIFASFVSSVFSCFVVNLVIVKSLPNND